MKTYKEFKENRVFELRPNAYAYGWSVGLIQLESGIIPIEGDLNNVNSYPFNVLVAKLEGLKASDFVNPSSSTKAMVTDLAKRLEEQGVKSLTYSNGLLASCHEEIVNAVDIPVVNILELMTLVHDYFLGGVKRLGFITSDSSLMSKEFLTSYGYMENRDIKVIGTQELSAFSSQLNGQNETLDSAELNEQITKHAISLLESDPKIRAFVIESHFTTPYTQSIRTATGLPVYDLRSALEFVNTSTNQKEYSGDY